MKNKLTPKFIDGIKPNPAKRLDFRDDLMPGLVLRVSQSGTKTFCLHRRINGKMRRLNIGRFGVITLAEARERVRQVLYEIESGRFEERTGVEVEDCKTLGEIIPDYVEKHAKSQNRDWRNKQSLLAKFTELHGKRLNQIKRTDVVKALDAIVVTAPVSANRALAHLKHLMNWCVDRGMLDASPLTGMKLPTKETPRERVLTNDELRALWEACDTDGYPFGDCMKLLILSGQRRTEVAEMRWSELDLDKRLWTLPSTRAKNGKQHTVPITDTMLTVLRRVGARTTTFAARSKYRRRRRCSIISTSRTTSPATSLFRQADITAANSIAGRSLMGLSRPCPSAFWKCCLKSPASMRLHMVSRISQQPMWPSSTP